MSSASNRSPKRRRRNDNDERCSRCARKKHLYLALDDWSGGYSVHKLDPDDMPEHLSEPPAVRVSGPDWGTMSFAAFGANLFIGVSPYWIGSNLRAPPTLIYSTVTSALTVGPRLPDDHVCDLDDAVAAGGRLYAMSSVYDKDSDKTSYFWQILQPTGDEDLWDPSRAWWWWSKPAPPLMQRVETIVCHAKHPAYGRTIFMSTGSKRTYAFDTGKCECMELGDWVLPFTGQAHYDPEFDALVGLHAEEDGCVCLCPVPSRSSAARQPPACTMLREKLCCYIPKDHDRLDGWSSIKGTTTLTRTLVIVDTASSSTSRAANMSVLMAPWFISPYLASSMVAGESCKQKFIALPDPMQYPRIKFVVSLMQYSACSGFIFLWPFLSSFSNQDPQQPSTKLKMQLWNLYKSKSYSGTNYELISLTTTQMYDVGVSEVLSLARVECCSSLFKLF